jgi:hypothetical protein
MFPSQAFCTQRSQVSRAIEGITAVHRVLRMRMTAELPRAPGRDTALGLCAVPIRPEGTRSRKVRS